MSRNANALKLQIERWTLAGLIDRATADRLSADVEKNAVSAFSFGSVLAVMAALLIGLAVLTIVAANWEEIPRIARVLALFAIILASYVGGALMKARGNGFGEAFYLLGAITFGGSIALIGQMYHFSGDEAQALLIWCLGTAVAAMGLRSHILTNMGVVLAVIWLVWRGADLFDPSDFPHSFLLLAALFWAISYWTRSAAARHLILLSIILYAAMFGSVAVFGGQAMLWQVGTVLAVLSVIVFLAAHFFPDQVERFAQLGGPYPVHPLIGFLVGMSMIQLDVYESFNLMLAATLVAFAGIIVALLMRGRQSRLMRWLAYVAFTVELAFLYFVTIGTLVDTGLLFLFSGLVLAAVAYFIMRIEKRLSGKEAAEGSAA